MKIEEVLKLEDGTEVYTQIRGVNMIWGVVVSIMVLIAPRIIVGMLLSKILKED